MPYRNLRTDGPLSPDEFQPRPQRPSLPNNFVITGMLHSDPLSQRSVNIPFLNDTSYGAVARNMDGKKMDEITVTVTIRSWDDGDLVENIFTLVKHCFLKPIRPDFKQQR